MKKRTSIVTAAVLAVTISGSMLSTAPAQAATTITRNCGAAARMCLYYNSIGVGLNAEFGSDTDVWSLNYNVNGANYYKFKAGAEGSAGAGVNVWNNAATGRNFHTWKNFAVFQDSNYSGPATTVPYGYIANLGLVKNNNTSMKWL